MCELSHAQQRVQAASSLNYHVDFGPAGFADFVGVGTLSTRPFSYPSGDSARQTPSEYVQLPKPDPDPGQMALNGTLVARERDFADVPVFDDEVVDNHEVERVSVTTA